MSSGAPAAAAVSAAGCVAGLAAGDGLRAAVSVSVGGGGSGGGGGGGRYAPLAAAGQPSAPVARLPAAGAALGACAGTLKKPAGG